MTRPIIAIDIDDTLANHNEALAAWYNANFGTSQTAQSYHTDKWAEIWGVEHAEAERRAKGFFDSGMIDDLTAVNGAQAALSQLSKEFDLAIITVRRRQFVDSTYAWMNNNFPGLIKKDNVHFIYFWDEGATLTKAEVCKEIGAKYIIDDSVKHCSQAAAQGISALLFGDNSWNQVPELPSGVKRVRDWNEVLLELTQ